MESNMISISIRLLKFFMKKKKRKALKTLEIARLLHNEREALFLMNWYYNHLQNKKSLIIQMNIEHLLILFIILQNYVIEVFASIFLFLVNLVWEKNFKKVSKKLKMIWPLLKMLKKHFWKYRPNILNNMKKWSIVR